MGEETAKRGLDDVFGVDFGSNRIWDSASRQLCESLAEATMNFSGGAFVAATKSFDQRMEIARFGRGRMIGVVHGGETPNSHRSESDY